MISNYSELKDEVADFIHRNDLTAKMDVFTALAESQINKDLRALEMEARLAITFADTFTDLPDDYVEIRALELSVNSGRFPIPMVTPQQLDAQYSNNFGNPKAFTIQAGQIELRPGITAPATSEGELTYIARVPSLVTNSTNKILDKYPLIYLSAMLLQANSYVQDTEEMVKYAEMYAQQINQANKAAEGGRWSLPTVRSL